MTDDSIGETFTSKSICEWQLMGEIGQRGLNLSDSASQILACRHHLHCDSALRLWIFHGQHLTPCPERYFNSPPLEETLGLECVTEAWSQSVASRQRIGFMMSGVDDIRWTFSFLTQELLPPPLINHWTVLSLLSLLKRSALSVTFYWVEKWFQSTQGGSRVLTNCGHFPRLNSVALEWLSRGESVGISCILNTAFSIFHCPLAFS